MLAPRIITPDQLPEVLNGVASADAVAVGDGALAHRAALATLTIEVPPADSELHELSGAAVCRLAARGAAVPATPLYLRRPDAEIALETGP